MPEVQELRRYSAEIASISGGETLGRQIYQEVIAETLHEDRRNYRQRYRADRLRDYQSRFDGPRWLLV